MTMYRRHFICVIPLLLAALFLRAPTSVAMAQQVSDKPEMKLSELKPVVVQFVEKMSQDAKEHNGVEFTSQQKTKMVNDILLKMETQGPYAFIDP